jgi:tripartite-type tricarboxylate transporter receptor subunit TctC
MMRFVLSLAILVAATSFAAESFSQQSYPSNPIRLIVPYPAGGPTDIQARVIAQKITENWGQQVVVDNRSGAGGIVGAEIAARARPDGYTIILVTSAHVTLPSLNAKMPYDALQDFAPVTLLSSTPYVLVAHPTLGVKSVNELIALLKSKPGQISFASTSSGGGSHIAGELFKLQAGVQMVHVPYKGSGAAIPDVVGGHVPVMFENIVSVTPYVKSGRLIALAISTAHRSPILPNLPTVAESGLPGFDVGNWFAVLAPAATPRTIVTKLHQEIVGILDTQEMRARLASQGAEPIGSTPEECGKYMRAELLKWGKVIKEAGIKLD